MGGSSAILVTPAGPIKAVSLDMGLEAAEDLDVQLLWPDGWRGELLARDAYLAGDDAHRAALFKAALESCWPSVASASKQAFINSQNASQAGI